MVSFKGLIALIAFIGMVFVISFVLSGVSIQMPIPSFVVGITVVITAIVAWRIDY